MLYSTQVFVVVTPIISDSFYNARILRPGLTKTVLYKHTQRSLKCKYEEVQQSTSVYKGKVDLLISAEILRTGLLHKHAHNQ